MRGIIAAFRGSRRRKAGNQAIIAFEGISKAEELIGKRLFWQCPGKAKKRIFGVITAVHGRKGAVRALFERGLPGQALGTEVELL